MIRMQLKLEKGVLFGRNWGWTKCCPPIGGWGEWRELEIVGLEFEAYWFTSIFESDRPAWMRNDEAQVDETPLQLAPTQENDE